MIEILTVKFLTGDTILKQRTKVASGNKTEIQVFRNHIPCPRILKLIRFAEINDSTPLSMYLEGFRVIFRFFSRNRLYTYHSESIAETLFYYVSKIIFFFCTGGGSELC